MSNPFLCAAAYACSLEPFEGKMLVIDMDACAAGLCQCGTEPSMLNEVRVPDAQPVDFLTPEVLLNERRIARACRRYLSSERRTDGEAWEGMTCSRLEELFRPAAQSYARLLDQIAALPAPEKILMTGRMARFPLAAHCIRERFSPDPLLPDPLFCTPDGDPAEYARLGEKIFQSDQTLGHSIFLKLLTDGKEELQPLGTPEQRLSTLKNPAYGEPFLCLRSEGLTLMIDGFPRHIPLPEGLLADRHGILRAALTARKEELLLNLQSLDHSPRPEVTIHV